jgi:hypothetical protein
MKNSPLDPERIAGATARRLLERATALDTDGPTLDQLRQAAEEAGISPTAFDAAVAEWRAGRHVVSATPARVRWTDALLRNTAGIAAGWMAYALLAFPQRFLALPWLVHKLTDPVGLAIGAIVAARLRARTATVVLGGLAVSQGAEVLMDAFSGGPAIQGFGAHMALMIAGVAGVAVGRSVWRRSTGPEVHTDRFSDARGSDRPVDPTTNEADKRFMESLRLRRNSFLHALQLTQALDL